MAYKLFAILAFIGAGSAGIVPVSQVYRPAPEAFHPAPQAYHQAPQVYHQAPQVYHQVPQIYQKTPAHTTVVNTPAVYAAAPTTVVKTAAPIAYAHAPVAAVHAQPVLTKRDDEYDPHPQYKYGYAVQDSLSGDSKSQVEERDGDVVRGEYSLVDADGYKRVVQYTSDPVNGFNAIVNRIPLEHINTVVKAAPVAYTAPAPTTIVKEYAAPATYHQHY